MVMGLAMVLAQLIAGGHFSGQLRLHFDVYSIIFIHFKSNAFRQLLAKITIRICIVFNIASVSCLTFSNFVKMMIQACFDFLVFGNPLG